MNSKKILNILIFLAIIMSTFCGCLSSSAASDIETQRRETRKKIDHLKWLESVETNKLYKNQQKLENANINLSNSQNQIRDIQKDLNSLQAQLDRASREYNELNNVLASHIRLIYKSQRKAYFEILLDSEDINMLVDRLYFQKIIIKEDYSKMRQAKEKAAEIRKLTMNIEAKKHNLERSIASINSQQAYINRAIKRNEDMIKSLQTDRIAYQKAEKELAKQSESIGSYINRTAKDNKVVVSSTNFIKPIQGSITSPFGYRTHPIFNTRSFHSGIDIGGPNNGAIKASNSGKVIYTGWYGGYGKVVMIEHGIINGKPVTTLYAHMNSIAVTNGQRVTKGQTIGYEGTTGYSTGPHCHFEVRVNGQPNNPLNYI